MEKGEGRKEHGVGLLYAFSLVPFSADDGTNMSGAAVDKKMKGAERECSDAEQVNHCPFLKCSITDHRSTNHQSTDHHSTNHRYICLASG
ncbi:MAG TPA: hypothetical protein PK228_10550 [Saprospiraceae bacterium]|nr:hypothetical protein [Saprospiraceae bacterium]